MIHRTATASHGRRVRVGFQTDLASVYPVRSVQIVSLVPLQADAGRAAFVMYRNHFPGAANSQLVL